MKFTVTRYDIVEIEGHSGDWMRMSQEYRSGYIYSSLLFEVDDVLSQATILENSYDSREFISQVVDYKEFVPIYLSIISEVKHDADTEVVSYAVKL